MHNRACGQTLPDHSYERALIWHFSAPGQLICASSLGQITGRTVVNGYVRLKYTLGEISVVTEGGLVH